MTEPPAGTPSARQQDLLEQAYTWVLGHGLSDLSLRPLADAVGSSPRVLLFLFGSKEGLIRAVLARARREELAFVTAFSATGDHSLTHPIERIWGWLIAPEHRKILNLWVEVYGRSLMVPDGPWADFAARTVEDWLSLMRSSPMNGSGDPARNTLDLAVLRGLLLDLLATGDLERTTAALRAHLAQSSRWPSLI